MFYGDNNSSSKGIANRITYEDFRTPEINTICDPECRDIGMLNDLQKHTDSITSNGEP